MRNDAEEKRKTDLIISLENSGNFVRTHTIIRELMQYDEWTEEEIARLMEIAVENSQVHFILKDSDVKAFYQMLLEKMEQITVCAGVVMGEIG